MLAHVSDTAEEETSGDDNAAFGDAVREERLRLGLTAEEAASRAKLAYKTWLRIESGKPVRNMSYAGVDRLFGLPPGTALRAKAKGSDPRQVISQYGREAQTVPALTEGRVDIGTAPDGSREIYVRPHSRSLVDYLLQYMAYLSIEDLERVINKAVELQRAKEVEVLRGTRLVPESRLALELRSFDPSLPYELTRSLVAYQDATARVAEAGRVQTVATQEYLSAPTKETRDALANAKSTYAAAVAAAKRELRAFADELRRRADAAGANQQIRMAADRVDVMARQAEENADALH